MKYALLVLLIGALVPGLVAARTWHVAQDGSGDFTVIQDAVDAAEDGDVIEIGPGRYTDYQTIGDTILFDVHVLIPDGMSLTFNGAGSNATIIGSEDPEIYENHAYGIRGHYDVGVIARNLGIENCSQYGISVISGSIDAAGCRLYYGGQSIYETTGIAGGFSEGAVIRDCEFVGTRRGVKTIDSSGGVRIEQCYFRCSLGVYAWTDDSSAVQIYDCDFECYLGGIGFLDGSGGTVESCRFWNCVLELTNTGEVIVTNCSVMRDDGGRALHLSNNEPVTITDCVFESNGPVFWVGSYGLGIIRSNHFLQTGDDYWVYCPPHISFQQDIDLSGNWWGTTDTDELDEGIYDCNDNPNSYHCVIYEPLADGPVATELRSWSSIKGLFDSGGEE